MVVTALAFACGFPLRSSLGQLEAAVRCVEVEEELIMRSADDCSGPLCWSTVPSRKSVSNAFLDAGRAQRQCCGFQLVFIAAKQSSSSHNYQKSF